MRARVSARLEQAPVFMGGLDRVRFGKFLQPMSGKGFTLSQHPRGLANVVVYARGFTLRPMLGSGDIRPDQQRFQEGCSLPM